MYNAPNSKIEEKLKNLPTEPGVYFFKNKAGTIIYIGKAKNLRNRVRSYFTNIGRHQQFKTEILVSKISDIEYILTDTELEALLLESNLIRKHKPHYNIDLKDDKTYYPYIKITNELYPQIIITRKVEKDNAKYLGPYSHVTALRSMLTRLKKVFKIRTCALSITEDSIKEKKHRLCLNYHINICSGSCNGIESGNEYKKKIDRIIAFLTGNDNGLYNELQKEMEKYSDNLEFEKAAEIRNQLSALNFYHAKQKMENIDSTPTDFIAIEIEDNDACGVVFVVRNGRLLASNHFFLKGVFNKSEAEILEEFITLYYEKTIDYPSVIYMQEEMEEGEVLRDWLSSISNRSVKFKVPKIGEKNKMLFLARKNAKVLLGNMKIEKLKKDYTPRSIEALKRDLNLKKLPQIIECFDISHFAGRETVASMVCFKNAKPYKSRYRKFKIKTVDGIDDFASMREVVKRRYERMKNEATKENPLPDLIVIDGGKGQLSSAKQILSDLELDITVIGLAKRLEEVFFPNDSIPVMLPKTSSALKLLQQVRDEAHRFAVTFHKNLRGKSQTASALDSVAGLGPKRRETLLKKFGSIKRLKEASLEEITKISGITKKIAEEIKKL